MRRETLGKRERQEAMSHAQKTLRSFFNWLRRALTAEFELILGTEKRSI